MTLSRQTIAELRTYTDDTRVSAVLRGTAKKKRPRLTFEKAADLRGEIFGELCAAIAEADVRAAMRGEHHAS